jgi:1-acyl-sn-glycerol-3-phosphate acyltransferase
MSELKKKKRAEKINIRQLFEDKNARLASLLPGFVYSYLHRILHIDFINDFLEKHGEKKGVDFAKAAVEEFNISLDLHGVENLPDDGSKIFVSNHPLGGFDGMILITILHKKYNNIKVLTNDILLNIKNMDTIFVPINKHGKQSAKAAMNIDQLFQKKLPVLTFPAGLVSRRKKGIIKDPEWKKNFITKAVKYHRDVIPIHVSGRCTNFFYNLSNFRKFIGIKSNIEMLYLPDETYRQKNERITVKIGKPVPWQTFDQRYRPSEWAIKMQDYVYEIGKGETVPFSSGI